MLGTSTTLATDAPALIGTSAAMTAVREEIAAAARTQAKVLILGETGVGKEVVARLIHEQSTRRAKRFVAVNCSGIPETLLESELFGHTKGSFTGAYRDKSGLVRQADRGTLFLDELGEMSLRMQAMLLRFTETGEVQQLGMDGPIGRVDVRLITATNRNLRDQMAAGAFREDLFYRLNVIQIRVAPLRDRGDDILLLVHHYLDKASQLCGLPVPEITADAAQLLVGYNWPGNVRELRNVTERMVLLERGRPLTPEDLPAEVRDSRATHGGPPRATLARQQLSLVPHATEGGSGANSLTPPPASPTVERLWDRMLAGESFWDVVYKAFKAREFTRADLASIIDRGLHETRGSYRALVRLFNMPETDYKRFHAFLYQQQCNLPVAPYRQHRGPGPNRPDVPGYSAS